ncbi:carbohydrate kinase family protein [Rhizobium leguminosarum]|uniref:carbohydrate kinase family protein n=1 Tax=Rhizobium leguminosarum TaxID=384 RepID=UPI0010306F42|nr:carbohydrate kinase family protein [Rhizobium leguminosarum]TBF87930.1 carbohydrate kinase family protein [Rhizobium leguminosarum]TBG07088.1 carbohydrate kinase family protein [Rhizobium leguminosarum]TBG07562.1 carbohydrate kinase family protein [Rhizobium leguminosarum]TBG30773.1 carbohydrate kinase family protein [Rhizobium leguminosarum]TBG50013.1 carbohydrate kinase family protein [Rhizobium leguminosarum]
MGFLGVKLLCSLRARDIAFAYFHPLSNPYVEPTRRTIRPERTLTVTAENILRFGFLEGSARVTGSRVVYDPQSPWDPEPFVVNGSTANELALVMNEQEFKAYTRSDDFDAKARDLISSGVAIAIVIKRGIFGALVYSCAGDPAHIPLYRSSRVFKIGTGDIFSGVFAHCWAQERQSPVEAADVASRAVAIYCEDPISPIDAASFGRQEPVQGRPTAAISVYGAGNTLGRRYALQEALFCLRKLGVDASIKDPSLVGQSGTDTTGLVIADGFSDESLSALNAVLDDITILDEEHRPMPADIGGDLVTDDFASAIYQICMKRSQVEK